MHNLTSLRLWKVVSRLILGGVFLLASVPHFTGTETEMKIIPPALPLRREAVYITGVLEILGGIGLLTPNRRIQRFSSWGLVALLVGVFPANVYHAIAKIKLGGFLDTQYYLWGRLPFQALFIAWVLWCTSGNTDEA